MMIAVFSDVHGNVRALQAVLDDIQRLKPDVTLNLGDCVSGPLWPRETCDLLRSLSIPTVRGNHDRAVGAAGTEQMGASDRFAHERLTSTHRAWLAGLPFQLETAEFKCFHANPRDDTGYFVDEVRDGTLCLADQRRVAGLLEGPAPPLVLCGHSHQPRIVRLHTGAVVVNPGSVGCPAYVDPGPPCHRSETGAPHARYAVVTTGPRGVRIESMAIEYDWEDAAATAIANGQPSWAHALRTGYAA